VIRLRHTAFVAVAAIALTAGPATAKDFCVGAVGCEFQSIQPALDAAAVNPGHDRVTIGPGEWTGTAVVGGDVEIEGSGASTAIAGAPAMRVLAGTGAAVIRRVRLVGSVSAESGALTIRDALIDARQAGSSAAVTTATAVAPALHTVDLESVTLLGAGQQAIDARAVDPADHVSVSLRDSVVSGFGFQALARSGAGVANMSLDYSDVFPASEVVQHAAGTLSTTAVLHAAPGFAADGFTPAAGSPLIDAATPGAFGIGELDLLGHPRLAAFGCHAARRDIGAVEAVAGCERRQPRHSRRLTLALRRALRI
jgi:hypothetical protein